MTKIYRDEDANLDWLKDKTVAIIGYGSQGHAQAQNLRDSGVKVVVAELPGTANYERAQAEGFTPITASEATQQGDLVQILIPDEIQAQVYASDIGPYLTEGKALGFSHGFNIHYGQIVPPENVDVIMVAPKGPGHLLRRMFVEGKGVPSLIAIHQDYTGQAKELALAYAKGLGATRAGVLETTFREETETDLFGEQAVLCGGCTALILAGFETLVEAGYSPEMAYFECLHELKLIVDLINEGGLSWMRYSVSNTAEYGDLTRGPRVIDEHVRQTMQGLLEDIQTGRFAREWILENQANAPVFNALRRRGQEHLIEQVGTQLRRLMPWLREGKQ